MLAQVISKKNGEQYLIRVPGQLADIAAIKRVIVAHKAGIPITIADVAEVGPWETTCAQVQQHEMAKKPYWEQPLCCSVAKAAVFPTRCQPS